MICVTRCARRWTRRELRHFAGAEDEDVEAGEVTENLLRQLDRGVADRDRAFAEAGFVSDPLADGERGMEQAMGDGAGEMEVARRGVCGLHLTEDLRLADDQRIEPGGDAEQVPRRVARRGGSRGARQVAPVSTL